MGAVVPSTRKGTIVTDLAIRKGANEQVAFSHIREATLHVQRGPRERIDYRCLKIGSVPSQNLIISRPCFSLSPSQFLGSPLRR